jgi:hypothetical protein
VDTNTFQFSLSVPRDQRFAPTVRLLAVQAARYASCSEAAAQTFGGSVEQAVQTCLEDAAAGRTISVVVRRDGGPIEVLVDGHVVTLAP